MGHCGLGQLTSLISHFSPQSKVGELKYSRVGRMPGTFLADTRCWMAVSFSVIRPLKPPQTVSPTGNEVLQCLRILRDISNSTRHPLNLVPFPRAAEAECIMVSSFGSS